MEPPPLGVIFKADNPEISSKPAQFTKVARIGMKGLDEAFFWYPIAPPGYASLGCIVTQNDEAPSLDSFCCPRLDLVSQADILEMPITKYSSSKTTQCWSIWKVENQVRIGSGGVILFTCAYILNVFVWRSYNILYRCILFIISLLCQIYTNFYLQACTFLARSDLKKPSIRLAFAIGDAVKPKARENITAEMKIRYLSLTILDSLCGMVVPARK